VLLNNLSSFTSSWERADEFGDHILRAQVPKDSKRRLASARLNGIPAVALDDRGELAASEQAGFKP